MHRRGGGTGKHSFAGRPILARFDYKKNVKILDLNKCGSRGGAGGLDPSPGKSQVIWVSLGNKQVDPLGKSWIPLENVGPSWNAK